MPTECGDADDTMADPYIDTDYDQAFLHNLGSSPTYIITRVLMLLVVFWLLARGIVKYELTSGLLLLPIAFEFLLMLWGGLFLSLFVVDCRAFAMTAGRKGHVLFLTALVLGTGCVMLAVEGGSADLGRVLPGWQWTWHRTLETGLIWALVAELVWMFFSTLPEVRSWRQSGGRFVWTSSFDTALRLAAIFFIVLLGVFGAALFGGLVADWLDSPRREAWLVLGLLLFIEVGALAIGVMVHRDLAAKNHERAETWKDL